jgi:phage-related protein
VEFYEDADGRAPVEEFLDSLPLERRAKALAVIQLLRQEGPTLGFPYSSQVQGRLRELRTQYAKDKIRILYFSDSKRVLILLHGLVKRTDQLNKSDIVIAETRMNHHEKRKP